MTRKFTLIELLVVVAIIGILASMLLPVLGKARYTARLTACLNNQKQAVLGAQMYVGDYDGFYPVNYGVLMESDNNTFPWMLKHTAEGWDNRYHIDSYISLQDLNRPFSPATDFFPSGYTSFIATSYSFYFGYECDGVDSAKITKEGNTMTLGGKEFDVLVADVDLNYRGSRVINGHPDRGTGSLEFLPLAGGCFGSSTRINPVSMWIRKGDHVRGPVDMNFARADGSAFKIARMSYDGSGLGRMNYKWNNGGKALSERWSWLPPVDF